MSTRWVLSPDGIRIAYDVSGAGTPILLLHGGGGCRADWHTHGYVTPPLRTGEELAFADLPRLRDLLPSEIWRHRDAFFFEGMRLTLGPCHRRYAASAVYARASLENVGSARLDARSNLLEHVAGLPFAPAAIDAAAPDAGARWAWNLERRDRGAGPRGSFRIVDLPSGHALASRTQPQVFEGEFFFAQTGQRADLAGHQARAARRSACVAGGQFREPTDARGLAWRQYRPLAAAEDAQRPDDVFVYVPDLAKAVFQFQVPEERTVPYLLPDAPEFQLMPKVSASGFMVGLIEWACIQAVNPHLDWPAEQTVGTGFKLSHTSATPPGLTVTVKVELQQVEGRKLTFAIRAEDDVDLISEGVHERFVIDAARFNAKVAAKASGGRL